MTFSKSAGEVMFEQSRIAELVYDDDAIVPEGVIMISDLESFNYKRLWIQFFILVRQDIAHGTSVVTGFNSWVSST